MKRENTLNPIEVKNKGVSTVDSNFNKQLIKIQGKLTSQIRQRSDKDPYCYAFIKIKGHGADLPVIFWIKDENKPNLAKGDLIELSGNYSNSDKNIRKSFTCFFYIVLDTKKLNKESYLKTSKIKKECSGCSDKFFCLSSENYDYCKNCSLNGSRYANKQSNCSECDGSGYIKFHNRPISRCKLCFLTSQTQFFTNSRNLANHE